jgi:hypothetical protein
MELIYEARKLMDTWSTFGFGVSSLTSKQIWGWSSSSGPEVGAESVCSYSNHDTPGLGLCGVTVLLCFTKYGQFKICQSGSVDVLGKFPAYMGKIIWNKDS